MAVSSQLSYLKVDLGFLSCNDMQDGYLRGLLTQAAGLIARRGVTLRETDEDDMLTAMVAGWMYRARGNADEKKLPTYLRQQIHDRLAQQKMGGGEA